MNTYDINTVTAVSGFFTTVGYSVSATPGTFDNFDLLCESRDSGRFAVEVKGRHCPINQYPTMRVDRLKYDAALSAIDTGTVSNVLVCSVYDDGHLALGNILSGSDAYADGPRTTCFADNTRIIKHYHDVPRQLVYRRTPDGWERI